MQYFDLHCDTVFELTKRFLGFDNRETHISKEQSEVFDKYTQFFAFWSDSSKSDEENYLHFFEMKKVFEKEILPHSSESFVPHIAVEGGKLLSGKLERLDELKKSGVEMMTLVWGGECCIGGAHDTNIGLSSFGKDVVKKMTDLGMKVDLSHASDKTFFDAVDICDSLNASPIATHSNSRKVHDHKRNLTDEQFLEIKRLGGRVGISLCRNHLDDEEKASILSVIRHIEHYMELSGEDTVCLGCDLDGITKLPDGITGLRDIPLIAEELRKLNYKETLIEKIFWKNAKTYFEK